MGNKKDFTKGFTLIEVAVAVAIIGVLASLTVVTFTNQQIKARDYARSSKATLIADSLERYYEENGEYPSARAILNTYAGNNGTTVAGLLTIKEPTTLVMPKADTSITNSIAPTLGATDTIAYVPQSTVGNDNCQSSIQGGCDEFTLSYKEESTGNTVTIESRNKGRATIPNTPLQAPTKPTLAATQSGVNIVATSSAPTCSTSAGTTPRYSFRQQVEATGWSAWTAWQATTTYTRSGNTDDTSYSFQVRVRCESATLISDTSSFSDAIPVTYYVMPSAPAAPTISATISGTNAIGTSSTITCNYGTAQYRTDYRTNSGAWTSGSWSVTYVRTLAATNATTYGFTSTARCVNGTQIATSGTSAEDSVLYYAMPSTPAAPTMSATTSGTNVTGTSATITCNYGTAEYRIDYRVNSGAWVTGTWGVTYVRTVAGAATPASTLYGFTSTARCVNNTQVATSGTGAEDTVTYYPMPATPATPTINGTLSGATVVGTSTTVACNYGSAQYLIDYSINDGAWSIGAWGSATTRATTAYDGYKYEFRSTARCVNGTQTATSGLSAEDTYIDPIATPAGPTVPGPAGGAGQWATAANRTSTWSSSGCPAGTWATYQYNFLRWHGSWAWISGTWTNAGTGTSAYNSSNDWGVYYNIGVMQNCTNSYTTSAWSAATWGANYYTNYVGYSQLRGWSMRIMADNSVTLALANYGNECDAYTERQIFIETSWNNAAFVSMSGLGWYGYNTPAPHGLAIAHTTPSGNSAEFWPRTRCYNPTTGVASSSSGLTSISRLYNIGNLYNKGSSKYNISCGWGSANNSLCSGGYNSSGTNATGTSYDACAIRAGGIEDTANRYTPYISLSATPPCWLVTG